jgi:cytochrome c-type biogenesis protein CcmH
VVAATTLPIATLARAADRDRMNDLGVRLMCMCGCGQLLIKCNMTNCPKSVPMIKELSKHIDEGKTDQQILTAFIEKYGTSVQPAGGAMGQVAKIVAFIVVAIGAVAAALVVRRWKASSPAAAAPVEAGAGGALDPEYRRRVEEDLKKISPED